MTHMPPQFRPPTVLIDEWRRRASEQRQTNDAAAEVYERCARELEELDVHTEGAPAGSDWWSDTRTQSQVFRLALGFVAAGVFLAGLAAVLPSRSDVL